VKTTPQAFARNYIRELTQNLKAYDLNELAAFARELERVRKQKRTVYIMGNGGSAATASHIANDFSKTASVDGCPRVKALSLADNVSLLTAIANDISYDEVFVEQMKTLLQPGDLVVLISGSGNSPNVVRAADYARERGIKVVGLLGFNGGKLKDKVDILLHVKSSQYGVVEDAHLSVGHMLSFYLKHNNLASLGRK
jgi:D-sedoheptulose 7-phosphate isomerase